MSGCECGSPTTLHDVGCPLHESNRSSNPRSKDYTCGEAVHNVPWLEAQCYACTIERQQAEIERMRNPTLDEPSCASEGHLWSQIGKCVMCGEKRPDWTCSECGLPCFAEVPHTCYADYQEIKAERDRLRAELDAMRACTYADDGAHECKHCDARWGDSPDETSERQAAREDRAYCDGAQQALAIAAQSWPAAEKWLREGCGNRRAHAMAVLSSSEKASDEPG